MLLTLELVPIPTEEDISEAQIRDVNDRPILRAAIEAKADVLLTGDKDFLESGVMQQLNSRSRMTAAVAFFQEPADCPFV